MFTDELYEPVDVSVDDGLGAVLIMRIQAQRIASMASMSIHCPRTSQSSWAFSAMLLRSSMTNFSSEASFLRFVLHVLIVLKLVQIRCDRISPREVAV